MAAVLSEPDPERDVGLSNETLHDLVATIRSKVHWHLSGIMPQRYQSVELYTLPMGQPDARHVHGSHAETNPELTVERFSYLHARTEGYCYAARNAHIGLDQEDLMHGWWQQDFIRTLLEPDHETSKACWHKLRAYGRFRGAPYVKEYSKALVTFLRHNEKRLMASDKDRAGWFHYPLIHAMAWERNQYWARKHMCRSTAPEAQDAIQAILGEDQTRFQVGIVITDRKYRHYTAELSKGFSGWPTALDYDCTQKGRTYELTVCLLIRATSGTSIVTDPSCRLGVLMTRYNAKPLLRYVTLVGPLGTDVDLELHYWTAYVIFDELAKETVNWPTPMHLTTTEAFNSIVNDQALTPGNFRRTGGKVEVHFNLYMPMEVDPRNCRPHKEDKSDMACLLDLEHLIDDCFKRRVDARLRFYFQSMQVLSDLPVPIDYLVIGTKKDGLVYCGNRVAQEMKEKCERMC